MAADGTGPTRDVVVAGAGPVGLATALMCAARGLDVTVVDGLPAAARRLGSRAIFLHGAALRTLALADPALAERLTGSGLTWRGRRTLWAGRTVFHRTYAPVPGTRVPFTALPQQHLEDELRHACHTAGVRMVWHTPVETISVRHDHVDIGAGSGLRARFLVGADGARSRVRSAIGATLRGERTEASFVVVDLAASPDHPAPDERVFHFRHPQAGGRNVLILPFQGGQRLDLQCRPDDDVEAWVADPARWLPPLLPPGAGPEITWISHYRFHQLVADTFVDTGHRVLLAGDAAHLFAPFGARGLNSGIADAAAAADVIAHNLAGSATREPSLASYDRSRRQAAVRNRAATGQALHHLLATGRTTRFRQRTAAALSRHWQPAGAWLDSVPYGPRNTGIPGSLY